MAIGTQDYKLRLIIGGENISAKKALSEVTSEVNTLGGKFTSTFGGMVPIAGAVVGAITGIAAAAVGVGVELFSMAQTASTAAKDMAGFQSKTGLSANTLSALASAANLSGKSLSDLQRPIVAFNELISKARAGNEEAIKTLHDMGVTVFTDLRTALDQASVYFNNVEAGSEKLHQSVEGFGKKAGPDFISVMAKMKGGLAESEKEAARLGETLSNEDLAAARQFNREYGTLSHQLETAATRFGLQFAPLFADGMHALSEAYASHQGVVRQVGSEIATFLRGLDAAVTSSTAQQIGSWALWSAKVISYIDPVIMAERKLIEMTKAAAPKAKEWHQEDTSYAIPDYTTPTVPSGGGGGHKGASSARSAIDEANRKAEELARRNLQAAISGAQNNLQSAEKDIADTLTDMQTKLHEFGTSDVVVAKVAGEFVRLEQNINASLDSLEALENQKRATNTEEENALLTQEQRIRRDREQEKLDKAREDFKEVVAKEDKIRSDATSEALDIEISQQKQLLEIEERRQRLMDDQTAPTDTWMKKPEVYGMPEEHETTAMDELIDRWHRLKKAMEDAADAKKSTVEMGHMAMDVLDGMTNALQSSLEQYILYGDSVGQALKKALAAELAHISAVATVRALYATALGFIRLAEYDFVAAGHAFMSAGLWAALAVGTGLAGRAMSGGGKQDGRGSSNSGDSRYVGSSSNQQTNSPYTRTNDRAWMSGPYHNRTENQMLAKAIENLNSKLDTARPGDVLTRGLREKPGAIGEQVVKDWRSNSSQSRNAARTMGIG